MFSLKWHYFIQKYILVDPLASLVIHSHIKEKPKWDFQKKAYLAYRNNKVFSNLNSKHGEKNGEKKWRKIEKVHVDKISMFSYLPEVFLLFSVLLLPLCPCSCSHCCIAILLTLEVIFFDYIPKTGSSKVMLIREPSLKCLSLGWEKLYQDLPIGISDVWAKKTKSHLEIITSHFV